MKKHRAASTFLIVGVTIVFSIASVYSNYNCLLEADFLIRGAKFEAGDIDDLLVDKQLALDFMPSKFFVIGSLGADICGLLTMSYLQIVHSGLPFSPLRC